MKPILRLEGVSKRFGGVIAADNVSFSVLPGEVHGLIGPNGAGKSTLMNLISGILAMDGGRLYFNEEDITRMPSHMRARIGIGRTFQVPRFMQLSSIRDNLLMGVDLGDNNGYFKSFVSKEKTEFERELDALLKLAGFSIDWEDDINAIPFGRKKILEIVRSMLAHPKVMLVDEPAAGLNNKEIDDVMGLINYAAKEKGIGVLLIEHSMDVIMNICEDIVVINFGKIIATGSPAEVSSNEQVIEAYLGRDINA